MRKVRKQESGDLLAEYSFTNGMRGKYSGRVSKDSPTYLGSEQESRAAAKNGTKAKKRSIARSSRSASSKTKSKKNSIPA